MMGTCRAAFPGSASPWREPGKWTGIGGRGGGSLIGFSVAEVLSPGEEGTDGTSTCAMHRKGAGLEIGLQVSLECTLTPVTGSDSMAPFASGAPGQL